MAIPRFNFTRLLIDLATAHSMPPPIFIPAVHPLPGHHAFVCQNSGVDAIGGGATEAEARNTAARQVWIEMGHLITMDPRYIILCFSWAFSANVMLVTVFLTFLVHKLHLDEHFHGRFRLIRNCEFYCDFYFNFNLVRKCEFSGQHFVYFLQYRSGGASCTSYCRFRTGQYLPRYHFQFIIPF
jgi:hypothetical protein